MTYPLWSKLLMVGSVGLFGFAFIVWKWSVPENTHKTSLWNDNNGGGGRWL